MNAGRYLGAVVAVWVVRTLMNWLFYGMYMQEQYAAATQQWAGAFREVVPAYIIADLIFAAVFVWLWTRAGGVFGSGAKGGASYGFAIGLLAAAIPSIYHFYSVTFIDTTVWVTELVYALVAHAVIGVVAAMVYPAAAGAPPRTAAA